MPTTIHITDNGNQIITGIKSFNNGLNINNNLLYYSQPSGYLTGVGYSGNYNGGYFLGRTKLSQNTSRLVDSSLGNTWVAKESNRFWRNISISSDGKYQTAIVMNGQIYVSSDYGNSWVARDSTRNWWGISISSDGKYQTAVVTGGQIYVSSDYGNTWVAKESSRAWYSVSISSDGKYQSAVFNTGQIYVSSDYGNTWVAKESNRTWWGISISSDGKYQSATVGTGQIYVSSDYGNTWTAKDSNRNWRFISISSDGKYQTAVVYGGQIYISKTDEQIDGNLYAENGFFSISGASALSLPNNPLSAVGSGNTYVQVNIQNRATGSFASADLVITANNGNDSANYINLGINNSGYSDPAFTNGTGLDGYLFIDGGDLDIGTRTAGKSIEFHAGGTTLDKTIARINSSGLNVVSGNLTVNNTGVLLSGQNSFIINLFNISDTQGIGHNYFGNISNGFSNNASNRQFPILESCVVRKATWTQFAGTYGNPSQNSTGYFINTTTFTTGIISTTINTQTSTPTHYIATFSPPITISTGDYIVCSLFGPTYAPTFPATLRNSVNLYCYN